MKCRICRSRADEIFSANFLSKHHGIFDFCSQCGFLSVRNPHWLTEAYSDAVSVTDTGLVQRNLVIAKRLSVFIYFFLGISENDKFLDYAGGYGLLTRLMRDSGFQFYWQDLYCSNLMARGFEHYQVSPPFKAVTMFEALEHIDDPLASLENILQSAASNTLVFSTLLYGDHPPKPGEWWYYSLDSGQHISFYSLRTLRTIGAKLGLRLYSHGSFHVFTDRVFNPCKFGILCDPRISRIAYSVVKNFYPHSLTWTDYLDLTNKPR